MVKKKKTKPVCHAPTGHAEEAWEFLKTLAGERLIERIVSDGLAEVGITPETTEAEIQAILQAASQNLKNVCKYMHLFPADVSTAEIINFGRLIDLARQHPEKFGPLPPAFIAKDRLKKKGSQKILLVDPASQTVLLNGKAVKDMPKRANTLHFKFIHALARGSTHTHERASRFVSFEILKKELWGDHPHPDDDVTDRKAKLPKALRNLIEKKGQAYGFNPLKCTVRLI